MKSNRWKKLLLLLLIVPVLVFSILVSVLYWQQDTIVQELINNANHDFKGRLEIEDSHISPFVNFPYISIDLDHVRVYEDKLQSQPLVNISDVYLGFDVFKMMQGKIRIRALTLSEGTIKLVQHIDGSFNIANALSPEVAVESDTSEFSLGIRSIQFKNIELIKINEETISLSKLLWKKRNPNSGQARGMSG